LTSRALDFIGCNWGSIASVVGLVLSGLAAFFGKRASTRVQQAREETRKALLSGSLAEEINLAQHLASEIVNLAEIGNHQGLRFRSNDLHARTLGMLKRWNTTLSPQSKKNLLNAQAQLNSLRDVTRKLSAAPEPTTMELLRIQTTCSKIQDIFIEEHASAMKRNDAGG